MSIGYPDYGGINLIKSPQQVVSTGVLTIAAGQTVTLYQGNAIGISYAVKLALEQGAGGTLPFAVLYVASLDNAGRQIEEARYDIPAAANTHFGFYNIKGPVIGNTLEVTLTNNDTVTMSYEVDIIISNNVVTEHVITTALLSFMMAGFNLPPSLSPLKGIMGTWYQAAVPAGSSVPFLVPPAPGPVSIGVRADSGTSDVAITAAPYISENAYGGLTHGNLLTGRTDANGNFMATINFPRSAMAFNIQNKGAAAQGISTTLVFDVTSG